MTHWPLMVLRYMSFSAFLRWFLIGSSAFVLLVCLFLILNPYYRGPEFTLTTLRHETGYAWKANGPRLAGIFSWAYTIPGDTKNSPEASTLSILEGGRQLGPAHSPHDEIQRVGGGRFSHRGNVIYFSTSDNTDPTVNGRSYTAKYSLSVKRRVYREALGALALFLLVAVMKAVGLVRLSALSSSHSSKPGRVTGRTDLIERMLSSHWLAIFASALAPLLYFLGNNAFAYSHAQIFASLGLQSVLAAGLALFLAILALLAVRVTAGAPIRDKGCSRSLWQNLPDAIRILVAAGVFVFFSRFMLVKSVPEWVPLLAVSFALSAAVIMAAFRWGVRALNIFLLPFLCITLATFLYNLPQVASGQEIVRRLDRDIRFQVKPNIYFFLLESYTGSAAMKEIYGIETAPFYQELDKRGFFIRDTYSNQTYTTATVATLMTMRHYNEVKWYAGHLDATNSIFRMINGIDYNPVLDVLKRNGYRVAYLQRSSQIYREPSPAVDISNLSFRWHYHYFRPWLAIATNSLELYDQFFETDSFLDTCKTVIRNTVGSSGPAFFFIYTGLEHTPHEPEHTWQTLPAWFKDEYRRYRDDFNPRLLDMLDFIEEVDPNAMIVLTGDHGAHMYRIRSSDSFDSLEFRAFRESGLGDVETIAEDTGSVIFAIKSPVQSGIWSTRPISHVNLFRYIFAMLANDETLLKDIEPDITKYRDYIIARDGKPLKTPVKYK